MLPDSCTENRERMLLIVFLNTYFMWTCECLHVCVHYVGACYPRSLVPEETGVPCKWNLPAVVSCLTQMQSRAQKGREWRGLEGRPQLH